MAGLDPAIYTGTLGSRSTRNLWWLPGVESGHDHKPSPEQAWA